MAALRPTGAAPEDPGDPGARARARAVIADAPPEGLAASVIARTAQINRTSAYRVLRQLTDAGDVVQTGSKGTWRYHPAAVPTAEQDTTTERGA
jgi:predicted transcriptional regulator